MSITLNYETNTLSASLQSDLDLEQLAEAALVADMKFKEAEAEKDAAKAAFKKALEARGQLNPDYRGVGVVRTVIKETKRFDKSLATQLLTPEEVAKWSTIDSALVKNNVTPDTYAMMQKSYGFSLELKVAD